MGLQMLTVNLRQTPRRRDTARYTQRPRGVRTTHKSRSSSPCAIRTTRRICAPLSTRNSLSFRRLSHKFNNLVVRKYRPVSPVFARRSRSDCSPRAASIDTLSSHRRWAKALRRNRCSVPFAKAAACRRNYRAGTCRDFAISPAKLSGPRELRADHAFGFAFQSNHDRLSQQANCQLRLAIIPRYRFFRQLFERVVLLKRSRIVKKESSVGIFDK